MLQNYQRIIWPWTYKEDWDAQRQKTPLHLLNGLEERVLNEKSSKQRLEDEAKMINLVFTETGVA